MKGATAQQKREGRKKGRMGILRRPQQTAVGGTDLHDLLGGKLSHDVGVGSDAQQRKHREGQHQTLGHGANRHHRASEHAGSISMGSGNPSLTCTTFSTSSKSLRKPVARMATRMAGTRANMRVNRTCCRCRQRSQNPQRNAAFP